MGPFLPRPVELALPPGLLGLRRKQRGCDPGSTYRVLRRHIQQQDAGSIDLTYAVKQLGQGVFLENLLSLDCRLVAPPERFNRSQHTTADPTVKRA